MRLSQIPTGERAPELVNAVIESPRGSPNKYEYNTALNAFILDRALQSPLCYPTEYGWIPGTLSEDGDPLDILVFTSHPTFPGCLIHARPIGVLHMRDEKGADCKIVAVSIADPLFSDVRTLDDLSSHLLLEIVHFFSVYREVEDGERQTHGWLDALRAHEIIRTAMARRKESESYEH